MMGNNDGWISLPGSNIFIFDGCRFRMDAMHGILESCTDKQVLFVIVTPGN